MYIYEEMKRAREEDKWRMRGERGERAKGRGGEREREGVQGRMISYKLNQRG